MNWFDCDDVYQMVKYINPDKRLAITIAVTCALQVLHIYENQYPGDLRPRQTIIFAADAAYAADAADAADAAYAAANAAAYAAAAYADAADAAAADAAAAAAAAAYAAYAADAADAAYAAYAAANAAYAAAAADAADAAAYAAANAAAVSDVNIPDLLRRMVPLLIDYAIQFQFPLFSGSGFNFEEILDSLEPQYRLRVLFNLDLFNAKS